MGIDETQLTATGKEWLDIFKENKWAISAYGTVFDQSRGLGVVAAALEAWYAERKQLQAEKKKWLTEVKRLKSEGGSDEEIAFAEAKAEDFELQQMSKKLTLNSTYGAMLSQYFRFGQLNMGGSVTACGRAITKHMIETIGHLLTGNNIQVVWYRGEEGVGGNGKSYNVKRSIGFDVDAQKICDVTPL